jgi:hypothetical protein
VARNDGLKIPISLAALSADSQAERRFEYDSNLKITALDEH